MKVYESNGNIKHARWSSIHLTFHFAVFFKYLLFFTDFLLLALQKKNPKNWVCPGGLLIWLIYLHWSDTWDCWTSRNWLGGSLLNKYKTSQPWYCSWSTVNVWLEYVTTAIKNTVTKVQQEREWVVMIQPSVCNMLKQTGYLILIIRTIMCIVNKNDTSCKFKKWNQYRNAMNLYSL